MLRTIGVLNDTSVGVGYAPLSETEHVVLTVEHVLNSSAFKHEFPETGEDIKVMAVRQDRQLQLTVAIAFVDEYIWDEATYFRRKIYDLRAHRIAEEVYASLAAVDAS